MPKWYAVGVLVKVKKIKPPDAVERDVKGSYDGKSHLLPDLRS